jgi:hypothetical protein
MLGTLDGGFRVEFKELGLVLETQLLEDDGNFLDRKLDVTTRTNRIPTHPLGALLWE